MKNVGNGLIIYFGTPLLCHANVHCHKQMGATVQWLTECCFKHAGTFNLVGVASIKKVVRHCTRLLKVVRRLPDQPDLLCRP